MGTSEVVMKDNVFELLQEWYLNQCDGDWEHEFGIQIDTLDNPGWLVNIDLFGTDCEGKKFSEVNHETSEDNWYQCCIKNGRFNGAGGP